ncbi:DUF3757 domain-containing protein [Pseudomonas sp. AF32]|uniref:DUF3757 domain-containing protein n=1 Tax=Pseudomonas sp. AF32 TaxID=554390 RepID=UPI001EED4A41|nr:DUF3757 domain-containing protein [Pseudomonas sp. AF32]MCG6573272.1 DUF3757 domain-containing protein [Pseudomonas sp. AF32]
MQKILAGGAGLFMLLNGYVHAGEIICPAVTDIQKVVGAVEDVYSVDIPDEHKWASESLVDVVDPDSLKFNGAEYAPHEINENGQATRRATLTCRYGQINLILEYVQLQESSFSQWAENRCESHEPRICALIDADYFNVSF